jgi:hypothetical protein
MSTTVIFWTQIGSLLAFATALFALYRILVATKDATIQLLNEKVLSLEGKLADARAESPDVLAGKLAQRITLLSEELERLSMDLDKNAGAIAGKELELETAREELSNLQEKMERAQELMGEFFCPYCKAPMQTREYHSELFEQDGREYDVDHEWVEYECGLTFADGEERSPCRDRTPEPHRAA